MGWSLRNQILIPIIVIQVVATATIAAATAWVSARRGERQVIGRLVDLRAALDGANFPLTAGVLRKMHGLSGAHFVALDARGRPEASSLPPGVPPPEPRPRPVAIGRLRSLAEAPELTLGGRRYFVASVDPANIPAGRALIVLYPETSLRQARWEAAWPPLVLGGLALTVMTIATGWTAQRIAGRIRRVERQVARIAQGHYEGLDAARPGDELHDLARSVNRMCDRLRTQRETIRKAERTGLLAQLAAGLAHQLRNALTGARMSIQLHARRLPAEQRDGSLDVALRQLSIVEEQVRGLLSLGRREARPMTPTDVAALVEEVAALLGPASQHARVRLECDAGPGPILLNAEGTGLRAAVLNLALNALEAAGAEGRVRLQARRDADRVVIQVHDTGAGPPPELRDELGEPFVTGKPEGVGLGLALARQVAAEHGGRLSWDHSSGETCFRIELPSGGAPAGNGDEPGPDRR